MGHFPLRNQMISSWLRVSGELLCLGPMELADNWLNYKAPKHPSPPTSWKKRQQIRVIWIFQLTDAWCYENFCEEPLNSRQIFCRWHVYVQAYSFLFNQCLMSTITGLCKAEKGRLESPCHQFSSTEAGWWVVPNTHSFLLSSALTPWRRHSVSAQCIPEGGLLLLPAFSGDFWKPEPGAWA